MMSGNHYEKIATCLTARFSCYIRATCNFKYLYALSVIGWVALGALNMTITYIVNKYMQLHAITCNSVTTMGIG
jgi:hypothetical protein